MPQLPLATIMEVKAGVIWRKTNKLIQSYYAFELKVFATFYEKHRAFIIRNWDNVKWKNFQISPVILMILICYNFSDEDTLYSFDFLQEMHDMKISMFCGK